VWAVVEKGVGTTGTGAAAVLQPRGDNRAKVFAPEILQAS